MRRTVLVIYGALVCFVSIACLAIGTGILIYGGVGVADPIVTLNPMTIPPGDFPTAADTEAERAGLSTLPIFTEDQRVRRRAIMLDTAIANDRKTLLQSIIRWSIACVVSLVLFVTHWRMLRQSATSSKVE